MQLLLHVHHIWHLRLLLHSMMVAIHCMYKWILGVRKVQNMLLHKMAIAKRIFILYFLQRKTSPDALVIDNTRERKDILSKFD